MKPEIELSVNERSGMPVIKLKRYDKDDSIEQKMLKIFIEKAMVRGMEMFASGGVIGNGDVYTTFEIEAKNIPRVKDPDRVRVSLNTREVPKSIEQKIHERIEQLERDIITADAVGAIIDQRAYRNTIIELKDLLSK